MGACASAVQAMVPGQKGPPPANKEPSKDPSKESAGEKLAAVVKTLTGFIGELKKLEITCFPAGDLAMALPFFMMDLEASPPIDYSKPSKKGKHPKIEYTPNHQAMAILADLAYLKGANGDIQTALFDSSHKQDSFAQHKTYEAGIGKPCWYSVADEQKKVVYVVVRGTANVQDMLSDINIQVESVELCGHPCKVHKGINAAALFVIEDSKAHVSPFLAKGFSLVFTGHSLGAGTAALAAAHARSGSEDGYKEATAVTFACPGVISCSKDCNKILKSFVTTFVLGFDIVPRATGLAVFNLLDKIFSSNWKEKVWLKIVEVAKEKAAAATKAAEENKKKMGALGANIKIPVIPLPTKTEAQIQEEAAAHAKAVADIAEARKRITKLDHILPCGALRHCVAGDKSTNITKKRNFQQVILSPSEPGSFLKNHSMGEYLQHFGF